MSWRETLDRVIYTVMGYDEWEGTGDVDDDRVADVDA